jgi:hypothetical protein
MLARKRLYWSGRGGNTRTVESSGVNIKDAKSDAERFVEQFDITYPVVRDVNQELTRALGVRGLPETFFVDHRWRFLGTIAGAREGEQAGTVVLGAVSEEDLVNTVEALIHRAAASTGVRKQ